MCGRVECGIGKETAVFLRRLTKSGNNHGSSGVKGRTYVPSCYSTLNQNVCSPIFIEIDDMAFFKR